MSDFFHILSLPSWVLAAMATHSIYEATLDLYDPSEPMQQFQKEDLHDEKCAGGCFCFLREKSLDVRDEV